VAAVLLLTGLLAPRGIDVQPVEVPPGVLHLKSVCAPLD
jgi:N-dimethylarginine dimethylaminohydrolase